jgi:hypothetical protein
MTDIKLVDARIEPLEIDETLVELLESMLQEVKEGKIKSIAGTVLDDDGVNLEFSSCEIGSELAMLGALHVLPEVFKDEHLTQYEFED